MTQSLLSVIGFNPQLVVAPARHYEVEEVHLIAGPHPDAQKAADTVVGELTPAGIHVDVERVADAFDIVAWYAAWQRVWSRAIGRPIVNLTAGHGAAISAGALLAIERGLATCLFDQQTGDHHGFSPRILLHLQDLSVTDRRILRQLLDGEQSVGGVADELNLRMSTASRALNRLREKGFCGQRREGRTRINYLSPGVGSFIGQDQAPQ